MANTVADFIVVINRVVVLCRQDMLFPFVVAYCNTVFRIKPNVIITLILAITHSAAFFLDSFVYDNTIPSALAFSGEQLQKSNDKKDIIIYI